MNVKNNSKVGLTEADKTRWHQHKNGHYSRRFHVPTTVCCNNGQNAKRPFQQHLAKPSLKSLSANPDQKQSINPDEKIRSFILGQKTGFTYFGRKTGSAYSGQKTEYWIVQFSSED